MIATWQQRCETHPDHQQGMVTNQMIMDRMQEEIDELRAVVSQQMTTDGPQPKGGGNLPPPFMEKFDSFVFLSLTQPRAWVEVTKKEYEKLPDNQRLLGLSSEATVKESLTVEATCKEILQVEPVGYFSINSYGNWEQNESGYGTPLYEAPPKREPLTESFLEELAEKHVTNCYFDTLTYAREIERLHNIGDEE